jgi:hypothetical protein
VNRSCRGLSAVTALLDTVVSRPNRYTTESLWIQSHVARIS